MYKFIQNTAAISSKCLFCVEIWKKQTSQADDENIQTESLNSGRNDSQHVNT